MRGFTVLVANNFFKTEFFSIFSKLIEKIVHDQLLAFMQLYKILIPKQFAFKKLHSTITSLINVSDYWYENINDKKVNNALFLDLKEAFDTVDHEILISLSLSLYVPCPFKTWAIMAFHSFLSFVLLSSSCSFIPPLCPSGTRSAIHVLKLVKYFIRGLPLFFFPSMSPVSVKFSTLSFLITCPKNSN